jgi:hypothetical protein
MKTVCNARLPARGVLVSPSAELILDPSGQALPVVEDVALSAMLLQTRNFERDVDFSTRAPPRAFRVDANYVGLVHLPVDGVQDSGLGGCPIEIVANLPDDAPVAPGKVTAVIDYVDGSSPGCACSEFDRLYISTTKVAPYFVAYIAPTDKETADKQQPDVVGVMPDSATLEIALGEAEGHQRSGSGFRRTGKYCFSIAAMTDTGQIGPRTTPECLDTTDAADPHVRHRGQDDCSCRLPGGGSRVPIPLAAIALASTCALVVRRLRPRR